MRTWRVAIIATAAVFGLVYRALPQNQLLSLLETPRPAVVPDAHSSDRWQGTAWEGYCEDKPRKPCRAPAPTLAEVLQECCRQGRLPSLFPDGECGTGVEHSAAATCGLGLRNRLRELVCCPDCTGPRCCYPRGGGVADPGAAVGDTPKPKQSPSASPKNELPETAPLPPRNALPKSGAVQSSPRQSLGAGGRSPEKGMKPICPAEDYVRLTAHVLDVPEGQGSLLR
jgi:hypothetical protein